MATVSNPRVRMVRFATFELDLGARELRKSGSKIKVHGQPFEVLAMLLERPGEIVPREELKQKLWPTDTFVDFDHGVNTAINRLREALGDSAENPRFVETIPRRGYRFIAPVEGNSARPSQPAQKERPSPRKQAHAIDSLAVLPLENASGDPETEYLSDGIAETLINSLARLRKIRVVPRTLSFRYRGAAMDVLKVGHELGVRAVLAGRMMQRGEDLILSVELVDVERQAQRWGSRYNRKMADLIALQEELVAEISEKLLLQLTGEEKKRLRKHHTQNNEAFRLVLQAQHYLSGVSPEGIRTSIILCQRAIEIDPAYATAYARLSFAYSLMGINAYMGIFESDVQDMALSQNLVAAKRALELDDTLSEAHVSLAYSLFYRSWDLRGAEREVRRALELDPDSADGWAFLDLVLLSLGRFEEAITAGKRAAELAPLYGYACFALGVTYYHAQQCDKAIAQLRKTIEIDPGSPLYRCFLAQAYAAAGQRKNAVEECDVALALNRTENVLLLNTATAYAMLHEEEEARRLLDSVEQNWKPDGVSAFLLAAVHACLDEKDSALEWLEKAFQERSAFIAYLKIHWPLHCLHGDTRFDKLVKRIGIPD